MPGTGTEHFVMSVISVSAEATYDPVTYMVTVVYTYTRTTTWSDGSQTVTSEVGSVPPKHTAPETQPTTSEPVLLAPSSDTSNWYASRQSRCSSKTCKVCIAHDHLIYTEADAQEWESNGKSHRNCQCTMHYFPKSSLEDYLNHYTMDRW